METDSDGRNSLAEVYRPIESWFDDDNAILIGIPELAFLANQSERAKCLVHFKILT
jgi:hypothetical protein